jgi:hypothetical protein
VTNEKQKKFDVVTALREVCLVAGFFSYAYGLWSLHPPTACIVCGALLMWIGLPKQPPRTKGGGQ